jgi:hypothetical protein
MADKEMKELLSKGFQGFGIGSWEDVDYINKALNPSWTYDVTSAAATAGDALRVQSLEYTLKIVTYQTKHFTVWKELPKLPAFSTIEEYTRLEKVGGRPGAAFFTGGAELPPAEDSQYSRQYAIVKFLGTTRAITLAMARTRTILGDLAGLIAQENINATNWILRNVEWGLFHGYSKGRNNTEFIHFDGFPYLIDPANVINARDYNSDGTLTEAMLNDAAQVVLDNFGVPTHIILSYKNQADLMKLFADRQRVFLPTQGGGYTAGVLLTEYVLQSGVVKLLPNLFCDKTEQPVSTVSEEANVTAEPISGGVLSEGNYVVGVEFVDFNGAIINEKVYKSSAVSLSGANRAIKVTVSNIPSTAHQIWVYMTEPNGSTLYQVKKIAAPAASSGDFVLDGTPATQVLPNTYSIYVGELTQDVIAFKQLAPLVKMDLAVIGPAYRWMVLLYGTPVIYAPKKWCRIINVK